MGRLKPARAPVILPPLADLLAPHRVVQALLRDQVGVRPGLAVVLAGDDAASRVYVRNKTLAAEQVGVVSRVIEYPGSVTEAELMERISSLNADPGVHSILVQLPLPKHIDSARVLGTIAPQRHV